MVHACQGRHTGANQNGKTYPRMLGQNPTVQRRRLGAEFRRLRERSAKKIEDVAAYVGCAKSTMSRIESGRVGINFLVARALLDFYQVEGPERDMIIFAARESRKPSWWRPYAGVIGEPLHDLLGLEGAASSLKVYETTVIPGLLQLESYTRELMLVAQPCEPEERREKRIELRMMRQRILMENSLLKYLAIIEETVLRRPVGGQEVMSAQLVRLVKLCQLPHVCIQIAPMSVGAHTGMDGPFTVLQFSEPQDSDVVYTDTQAGCFYLEAKEGVESYQDKFQRIQSVALDPARSLALIGNISKEIK